MHALRRLHPRARSSTSSSCCSASSIIVFLMIRLIPGDAVAIMLGANTEVTPERIAELRARIGLDQPIVEQYVGWAGKALRGDLGTSLWTGHAR